MDDQLHLLTGAYALNALDEDERRHFETSLTPGHPVTEEARELSQVAALLAAGTTPVAPPADLKARLMAQIAITPQVEAVAGPEALGSEPAATEPATTERPTRETPAPQAQPTLVPTPAPTTSADGAPAQGSDSAQAAGAEPATADVVPLPVRRAPSSTRWLAAVATVLAVAAAGTAGWAFQAQSQRDEAQRRLAAAQDSPAEAMNRIIAAPDAKVKQFSVPGGATMLVMHSEKEGRGGVMTLGMSAPPQGKSYELWLIDQAGAAKPAGLLESGGGASTWNELPGGIGSASFLGVTVEPEGGSAQPTTKPILVESIT
ncbi:anti-sigma factor [Arthrobacter sp. Y-9]|uniref:anti-sigma factor domain-containing protein n=1 Tax=Arthrobacter sp. Y-9 TaxID=3039385 RepID=UPI00241DA3D6|nr:anti-sigma factor [Arthrobacter sp. Y-9]WFR84483.1 anti-sigma factor [Arthrobacter sp. Y-9]